jgi:hypothetical protein
VFVLAFGYSSLDLLARIKNPGETQGLPGKSGRAGEDRFYVATEKLFFY